MKLFLNLILVLSFFLSRGYAEEYSIRKKAPPKKKESAEKKAPPSSVVPGFSKENNRISNLFWLEDSALFLPEFSDSEAVTIETPTIPPPTKTELPISQPNQIQEDSSNKQIEKEKQNFIFQFLIENKKILLIITLIIIFAVYRLRGNTPTYSNQGRIFSKFRNK